jgi:hypothetical protein
MSKQTAVEWLQEQLNPDMKTMQGVIIQELLEQAKAMEKEQIVDAYVECYMNHVGNGESILREANSVYAKTYGGDK